MTYEYQGTVMRWVDGDTVWLTVWREERMDFGFRARLTVRFEHDLCFRVYGINTPEDSAGKPAAARARELAPVGSPVTALTYKPNDSDKYGRWLATIRTPAGIDVAAELIAEGHGRPYFGGTRDAN